MRTAHATAQKQASELQNTVGQLKISMQQMEKEMKKCKEASDNPPSDSQHIMERLKALEEAMTSKTATPELNKAWKGTSSSSPINPFKLQFKVNGVPEMEKETLQQRAAAVYKTIRDTYCYFPATRLTLISLRRTSSSPSYQPIALGGPLLRVNHA